MKTPCIEWKGRKNNTGYGVVLINNKQFFAHRLAVALSGRNIPKTKVCDHLCRNHACINPEHIELVTLRENWRRGESKTSKFVQSDSCSKGHLFDKQNTRIHTDKNGRKTRHCKRCYADREYVGKLRRGIKNSNGKRYKYGK